MSWGDMQGVNKERITTLIGEGTKALSVLEGYLGVERQLLLSSEERMGNIKYQFIVAIEAAVDICQHVSSRLFGVIPESYAGCFESLREHAVLDGDLAKSMSEFARFRNVLVHRYWVVDDNRVVDMISRLGFLRAYFKAVAERVLR